MRRFTEALILIAVLVSAPSPSHAYWHAPPILQPPVCPPAQPPLCANEIAPVCTQPDPTSCDLDCECPPFASTSTQYQPEEQAMTEASSSPTTPATTPAAQPQASATGRASPAQAALAAAQAALVAAQSQADAEAAATREAEKEIAALQDTGGAVDPVSRRALIAVCRILKDVTHNEGAAPASQSKLTALINVLAEGLPS